MNSPERVAVAYSFLDKVGQERLTAILRDMTALEQPVFLEALHRPPIHQGGLLNVYRASGLKIAADIARDLLLAKPSLMRSPEHLESLVERALVAHLKGASERVCARYASQKD